MIYIVTGAARAGKSAVMQMLQAGGMELTYDKNYLRASSFNENGFFEYRRPGDELASPEFRESIDGKVMNVVANELHIIPFITRKNMKIIWVQRDIESLFQSAKRVNEAGALAGLGKELDRELFIHVVTVQLKATTREVKTFNKYITINYEDVVHNSRMIAEQLAAFVAQPNFDMDAAAKIPEERLCHFQ